MHTQVLEELLVADLPKIKQQVRKGQKAIKHPNVG